MFTTAILTICDTCTHMVLIGDNYRNGEPDLRFDLVDSDRDEWQLNPTVALQCSADTVIGDQGYTRTGEWRFDSGAREYTAPIAPTSKEQP